MKILMIIVLAMTITPGLEPVRPPDWRFQFINGLNKNQTVELPGDRLDDALALFRKQQSENAIIVTACRIGVTDCRAKGF